MAQVIVGGLPHVDVVADAHIAASRAFGVKPGKNQALVADVAQLVIALRPGQVDRTQVFQRHNGLFQRALLGVAHQHEHEVAFDVLGQGHAVFFLGFAHQLKPLRGVGWFQ